MVAELDQRQQRRPRRLALPPARRHEDAAREGEPGGVGEASRECVQESVLELSRRSARERPSARRKDASLKTDSGKTIGEASKTFSRSLAAHAGWNDGMEEGTQLPRTQ